MAYIAPIGPYEGSGAPQPNRPATRTPAMEGGARFDSTRPGAGTGQTRPSNAITQLQDALVDVLQATSLDPASQRLMRLMIGLIILMAILDSLRGSSGNSGDAGNDALSAMSRGVARSGGEESTQSTMVAMSYYEQTTTTIVMFGENESTAPTDPTGASGNGRFDLTA